MVKRLRGFWKSGIRGWLVQRVSAVVMLVCLSAFIVSWQAQAPGFAGWKTLFESALTRGLVLLFFFSLFAHAWLGMRHVLGDYVRRPLLRVWLRRLVQAALTGYAAWLVLILFNT